MIFYFQFIRNRYCGANLQFSCYVKGLQEKSNRSTTEFFKFQKTLEVNIQKAENLRAVRHLG